MARISSRDKAICFLRQNKRLYSALRAGWRRVRVAGVEGVRRVFPRRVWVGLPRGVFSLAEQIRSGEVPGRIFHERQEVPAFSPASLVKRCGLRQDEFQPWPVFWAEIKNARLFGRNLVLLNDRKQACQEFMFAPHCPASDESYQIPTFGKPAFLSGRWTSLVSRWDDGYWHFLMDALPRLHALSEFPEGTGILIRSPIEGWQWEVLEMLGVADRVRPTMERHLIVEELYFSSHTSMTGAWNPAAVAFLRERLLMPVISDQLFVNGGDLTEKKAQETKEELGRGKHKKPQRGVSFHNLTPDTRHPTPVSRKLFIKRGSDWTRGIRNQDEMIRFFEQRGWTIMEPEKFSVKEQITIFSQAEVVCGAHGSALTNILWMKPGARVIELLADNFMLGAFEWLARCIGLRHEFLVFPGDHRLSFEVDMDVLRERLKEAGSCSVGAQK